MRPKRITQIGAGTTAVIPLDYRRGNVEISFISDVLAGSPIYTIELTGDDVQVDGYDPSTGNWHDHSYVATLTEKSTAHIDFPATAMRLKVVGAGTVQTTIIHGG